MEAFIYRSQWPQYRRLVLGALIIIVMAYILDDMPGFEFNISLVLAAQIFLYVLLFKRPVWAMAALIVGQLTIPTYTYYIGEQQVSAILSWSILTLLILVPIINHKGRIELGGGVKRIIIPAIILASVATVSNCVNNTENDVMQFLRQEFSWLVIIILLPAAVKNERDLKRLALVALITSSVSAIFALVQWYTPALRDEFEGRMVGLTMHPSHLGYTLPLVLLPTVAVYFLKGLHSRARKLIILPIIIMSVGLYFSFTRVGMFSLAPGLLLMVLLMKGKPKRELFLVTLILGAAFFYYVTMDDNRYVTDEGTGGRLALWQAGAYIALDYPILGIGAYNFREMAKEYLETIDSDLIEQGAGGSLGFHAPHNDYITVWASFGTVALLAYLWLFVGISRNLVEAIRHSRTRFLKSIAIGCLGATAAYVVNSATHNMLIPSMLIWILAGFSVATVKLAAKRQAKIKLSPVDTGKY